MSILLDGRAKWLRMGRSQQKLRVSENLQQRRKERESEGLKYKEASLHPTEHGLRDDSPLAQNCLQLGRVMAMRISIAGVMRLKDVIDDASAVILAARP